jgi:hypothetical protein
MVGLERLDRAMRLFSASPGPAFSLGFGRHAGSIGPTTSENRVGRHPDRPWLLPSP